MKRRREEPRAKGPKAARADAGTEEPVRAVQGDVSVGHEAFMEDVAGAHSTGEEREEKEGPGDMLEDGEDEGDGSEGTRESTAEPEHTAAPIRYPEELRAVPAPESDEFRALYRAMLTSEFAGELEQLRQTLPKGADARSLQALVSALEAGANVYGPEYMKAKDSGT